MNIAIFPNFLKNHALECALQTCDILKGLGACVFADEKYSNEFKEKLFVKLGNLDEFINDMDFAIAIGGDGTILKCARKCMDNNVKLLGINTGKLGFMASLETDELSELKNLFSGNYKVIKRMMLRVDIHNADGTHQSFDALNDVSIARMYSKICYFDVYAENMCIGQYRADGVVFSTPTGSTAYSLSAGGPIIEPYLDCIEMNLICPHSLFTRPMLFSPEKKMKIIHHVAKEPPVYINVDGSKPIFIDAEQVIEISKSDKKISMIDMKGDTFYEALHKKLMQSIKNPC